MGFRMPGKDRAFPRCVPLWVFWLSLGFGAETVQAQTRGEKKEIGTEDVLAKWALYQSASGHRRLAQYSEAASSYEEFAKRYPGERQAVTALDRACQLRISLGEFDKALDDMNSFIKYFGIRRRRETAQVVFEVSEVYERQQKTEELAKYLDSYLKKWGAEGGIDQQILAHFKLGEIAWAKSCPQKGMNGACIKIERLPATANYRVLADINAAIKNKKLQLREALYQHCPSRGSSKVTVRDRSPKLAKQGQYHFKQVMKLWKKWFMTGNGPDPHDAVREASTRFAAAGAAFYQAEQVYERYLKIRFPRGLDFQHATWSDTRQQSEIRERRYWQSTKRYLAYFAEKSKLAEELAGPSPDKKGWYDFVFDYRVGYWAVAAAARIGQVFANFVDQLDMVEIPRDLKEQDEWGNRQRETFCDIVAEKAAPFESKAVFGFDLCLKVAAHESSFGDWSNACEVELNQLRPSEYPLAAEEMPEPGYVAPFITAAAVIPELPGDIEVISGGQ